MVRGKAPSRHFHFELYFFDLNLVIEPVKVLQLMDQVYPGFFDAASVDLLSPCEQGETADSSHTLKAPRGLRFAALRQTFLNRTERWKSLYGLQSNPFDVLFVGWVLVEKSRQLRVCCFSGTSITMSRGPAFLCRRRFCHTAPGGTNAWLGSEGSTQRSHLPTAVSMRGVAYETRLGAVALSSSPGYDAQGPT